MSIPENVLELLRKLLAFEEGANKIGSLNEAEVAAAKIQEILLKYNLDREKITGEKSKYVMVVLKVSDYSYRTEGKWIRMLLSGIAIYNLCEVVIRSYGSSEDSEYCLIGTEDNTEIVVYLFNQLRTRISDLSKEAWKRYYGPEKKNTYLRGFLMGAAIGIRNKLQEEWEKAQKENQSTTALIKSNAAELTDYKHSVFKNLKSKGYSSSSSIDGYLTGKKVGKSINIHKGIEG